MAEFPTVPNLCLHSWISLPCQGEESEELHDDNDDKRGGICNWEEFDVRSMYAYALWSDLAKLRTNYST